MNTINKEKLLNKRYEKHLNLELRKLASQNVQRDYYIKEQEPGLIDLYSKDGFEVGELIELGFKSIEDAARYIDILSGYKNPKLFPEQPTGRTNREKFIGTCIMLDASAQECLKDLIDANYRIWPDSFHSFIIAEDRDVVDKLIKKYHLTEMRRGVDIFDTHNVYNGDIVDYVSQSTIDGDEYSGASINRTFKDIMKDARKTRHNEYAYLSQKYDFDESLEKSIYEQMNDIDDQESLSEDYLFEARISSKRINQIITFITEQFNLINSEASNDSLTSAQIRTAADHNPQAKFINKYHSSDLIKVIEEHSQFEVILLNDEGAFLVIDPSRESKENNQEKDKELVNV